MATNSVIVLCEDETQWLFIYRWLLARGLHPKQIRLVALPGGKRAGTQHVLKNFVSEVREYRKKAHHLSSRRLVVAIDADTSTVKNRNKEFEELLGTKPGSLRLSDNPISHEV